jgi:hypothetical protein
MRFRPALVRGPVLSAPIAGVVSGRRAAEGALNVAGNAGGVRGTPYLRARGLPERPELRAGLRGAARLQRRSLPERSQLRVSDCLNIAAAFRRSGS